MNIKVYCHENIKKVYDLHKTAIEQINENNTILAQLTDFSDNLFAAWKAKNPVCKGQINN